MNGQAGRAGREGTVDSELTALCTLRSVDGCVIAGLMGDWGMGMGGMRADAACLSSIF